MGRAYLIVSGKGGVGKTTIATSLALSLARRGMSVALVDADVGLRCADQLLDLQNDVVYDLLDVLDKRCLMQRALVRHPEAEKLCLLSAPQEAAPSDISRNDMARLFKKLKSRFDFVLVDGPAGIGRGIKNVWEGVDEALMVVTPDDVCIRDAERVSQLLFEKQKLHPQLILNRVNRSFLWDGEMKKPAQIAQELDMPLLAVIPDSKEVYRALLHHRTALECKSRAVRRAIAMAADRLLGMDKKLPRYCR